MTKKKIYFAHPVAYYDTPREAVIVGKLEEMGFEVLNPNSQEHQDAYKARPEETRFTYFEELVRSCDAFAYWVFDDLTLGAGVAKELLEAIVFGKEIYRVGLNGPTGIYVWFEPNAAITLGGCRILSIESTREITKAAQAKKEASSE